MGKLIEKIKIHPIMTFMVFIIATIVLSGLLSLFGLEATYNTVDTVTNSYNQTLVTVESLFSLRGLKYIFSSTVANFAAFTPLNMLIIILIGIGIMEKSGFLKTAITSLTQSAQKRTVTFVLAIICIISSIIGDLSYVVMIPISALIFYYGRRNPLLGIVSSFASLTCGTGLSIFLTSIDSSLLTTTMNSASILDPNYTINIFAFILIMIVAIITLAFVITAITERISIYRVERYEFKEEKKEFKLSKKEIRGLVFALSAGVIYLLIFIYNIIPGLPFSGNLLDYSQSYYLDKLFSYNSFFSQGFVFIITMLFVILGLFYGIGAKTIKNNYDLCDTLGHSLDDIGNTIVLIFMASVFINVFKKTNMGVVFSALLTNLIAVSSFKGIPLIILTFICVAIATAFLPNATSKYSVMAGSLVPILMNAGISPEMSQVIFRFAECVTYGLTPVMAYFVIYLAFIEKYNQGDRPISIFKTIKYQMPYALATGAVLLLIIIVWYVVGLPLGINALPTI
ncbi:MAG: AbgT family transporter [Bacilli bacterium]|nr:AbgT family transporter [Bacilli bacterium]